MKAIKYLLAGALITVVSAPSMAQDANAQLDAVAKVIKENKSNPEAYEDQVKDYVKENKKNGVALAALGRVFFELRDTANAKKYDQVNELIQKYRQLKGSLEEEGRAWTV